MEDYIYKKCFNGRIKRLTIQKETPFFFIVKEDNKVICKSKLHTQNPSYLRRTPTLDALYLKQLKGSEKVRYSQCKDLSMDQIEAVHWFSSNPPDNVNYAPLTTERRFAL